MRRLSSRINAANGGAGGSASPGASSPGGSSSPATSYSLSGGTLGGVGAGLGSAGGAGGERGLVAGATPGFGGTLIGAGVAGETPSYLGGTASGSSGGVGVGLGAGLGGAGGGVGGGIGGGIGGGVASEVGLRRAPAPRGGPGSSPLEYVALLDLPVAIDSLHRLFLLERDTTLVVAQTRALVDELATAGRPDPVDPADLGTLGRTMSALEEEACAGLERQAAALRALVQAEEEELDVAEAELRSRAVALQRATARLPSRARKVVTLESRVLRARCVFSKRRRGGWKREERG